MANGAMSAEVIAEKLGSVLIRARVLQDFVRWLSEDEDRQLRANRMLQIMQQDPNDELQLRPSDLFHADHLSFEGISEAADERAEGKEKNRPHVKACTLCNAFIEVEAARLVLAKGMGADMSGVYGQVLRTVTDNEQWFGSDYRPRE